MCGVLCGSHWFPSNEHEREISERKFLEILISNRETSNGESWESIERNRERYSFNEFEISSRNSGKAIRVKSVVPAWL